MRILAAWATALAAVTAWSAAEAVDVHILGFHFSCETPDGEVLKPKFGDVGGIFFTGLPEEQKPCLETIDRMIYSCGANTTFISHDLNRQYATCLPIFEKQAQECAKHFDLERAKCYAGGDDDRPEEQVSDAEQDDESVTWDTSEDDAPESDPWKPWEDEAPSDDDEDSQWVEVEDPNDVDGAYEPDDGGDKCDDVWSDCPRNTYWTEEQREGARQVELWVNYADPQAGADAATRDSDRKDVWGYEADALPDTTSGGEDASHHTQEDAADAREEYERALAGVLNEDGSAADLYSVSEGDYREVLEQMEAKAEAGEKARTEAERAAAEAVEEKERREAARLAQEAEQRRSVAEAASSGGSSETAGDGTCGSAPACKNYIQHGEQVLAQVNPVSPTSMTDGALLVGFVVRSTLGCMRKCLPHETSNACKTEVQSAISELQETYRSAIENARASSAGSSYVDDFDRDPKNSEFVRNYGIRVSGSSLDSCGD